MMGGTCHVACVEGMLCVASGGSCSRPDGFEGSMEGAAGADEMCMVHAQCRSEG